jgi:5-methyltetrahydropteroyltriglutamate--homocysteine methyltransferase
MSARTTVVKAANLGFPRIGLNRELKFALERYWAGDCSAEDLARTGRDLRARHWRIQAAAGIDQVPSNDFSLYDQVLDAAVLVGAVPARFRAHERGNELATYFAMARGSAGVPALEMTKWFDTNYHYIVPELDEDAALHASPEKPVAEYREARALGIATRPVLVGPVSLVLLAKSRPGYAARARLIDAVVEVYQAVLDRLAGEGVPWVQVDEPCLGLDLGAADRALFRRAYGRLGSTPKLLVATYFSDLRENLETALRLPVSALHLDLVRAPGQLDAALAGAPVDLALSLGVVDGRGIWRTDLDRALGLVRTAVDRLGPQRVQVAPSCSLLHVPMDVSDETGLDPVLRGGLAFAVQKLEEVALLARAATDDGAEVYDRLAEQRRLIALRHADPRARQESVRRRSGEVSSDMLDRQSPFAERRREQASAMPLPPLPTTTIGSLPQTAEVRRARAAFRAGRSTAVEYEAFLRAETERAIRFQEEIGLDVLVHGEFERNDMVEYFAAQLEGFAFTRNGWVQSFGSRCVKPPILFGDVSRPRPMSVELSRYAQSLTDRPVKGMLTGPVTMLHWSFVRDDLAPAEVCTQIALAVRDEVADLEGAGLRVVQVDEPALREGLPLRAVERPAYLQWAVDAFRLATAGAADETQIHTHMCYAEFGEILDAVARMHADVISIEAARSGMEVVESFAGRQYPNDIGPGVYDIHSPRVPAIAEIEDCLNRALETFTPDQLWVNPDCGLKTRSWAEVEESLTNLVAAARLARDRILLSQRDSRSAEPELHALRYG